MLQKLFTASARVRGCFESLLVNMLDRSTCRYGPSGSAAWLETIL